MAISLNPKKVVFPEIPRVSQVGQWEALPGLLVDKGMFTNKENDK
jgi:hypothetical protein